MATKKSIWILFGILIIASLLLGFATSAGAETYTVKWRTTGPYPQMNRIEVGDVPGHILYVGEVAGVASYDDGSVGVYSAKFMGEMAKGSGTSQGYGLTTYEDGSTQWFKFLQTVTPDPDGKTSNWEGTLEFTKGTGRFNGIQGSGTFTFKRVAPLPGVGAQFLSDNIATYTLPAK
jgi:hypothetical protein